MQGHVGVAAAHDGQGIGIRHLLDHGHGAPAEGVIFEGPHGPVPDNGFGVLQGLAEERHRRRPDVGDEPVLGHFLHRDDLGFGLLVQPVGHHAVHRQIEFDVPLQGLGHGLLGGIQQAVLHQGFPHFIAHGLEKGVGHGPADDHLVHVLQEILQGREFAGDLGAADEGRQGPGRVFHGPVKVMHLIPHQETPDADGGEMGDRFHRGMGPVGHREGVVHVDVDAFH